MEKLVITQEFLDSISKQIFGLTVAKAINQSICIACKEEISKDNIYTENGLVYYTASGLCDNCNQRLNKQIVQKLNDLRRIR